MPHLTTFDGLKQSNSNENEYVLSTDFANTDQVDCLTNSNLIPNSTERISHSIDATSGLELHSSMGLIEHDGLIGENNSAGTINDELIDSTMTRAIPSYASVPQHGSNDLTHTPDYYQPSVE